jgi:hypothetical protein
MKHVSDFPADAKWVQTPHGAIAVVFSSAEPWPRVYHMVNGAVVELKPEQANGAVSEQSAVQGSDASA